MIELVASSEQQEIIDSIAGFLAARYPVERLRGEHRPAERDERRGWPELAAQGWFGLGIPEDLDGAGYGVVEEMLAFREFGRFLISPRILATTLAAHVASAAGDADLVRSIVAGETRAAVANMIGPGVIGSSVRGDLHLIDSEDDDLLILWDDDGAALIERTCVKDVCSVTALDGSVDLERGSAVDTAALGFVPAAAAPIALHANLLIAAQLAGNAEATRDLAVEYAKIRMQFGKPIGAFQAVAHHCADMALRTRAALSQTIFAAVATRDARDDARFQSAAASIVATDAALRNATIAIRIHGGIGFTAECDVHHYLKRAHLFDHISGGTRLHQTTLLAEPVPNLE
ncbi:acyl-CoA dehydrogenase family protein [Mycobacterium sp. DL440]|uniref:acyl-CoA dehydrogenase family protein n=1 Tax=Mycobacterium sp. DL440 TaxID=2675523 RepID=UPI001421F170|nr:acyl-CoA dehydrogenase family protein [Mycobacterium sp. DL440]